MLGRRRALGRPLSRHLLLLREIELDAKRPALAPAPIKLEPAMFVIKERKPQPFVAAHGPIPTSVRVEVVRRDAARSREWLVLQSDDVTIEVVTWVAQVPHEIPAAFARTIPIRRDRFVGVAEPPNRVDLSTGAEMVRWFRELGHDHRRVV